MNLIHATVTIVFMDFPRVSSFGTFVAVCDYISLEQTSSAEYVEYSAFFSVKIVYGKKY